MELTMQQEQGLAVARMLVKAGVPMFLAQEDPHSPLGHKLPFGWETNEPDTAIVEAWRPGYALCAVTGHTFDLVDIDPRGGGDEGALGQSMPHVYLTAETPSGGRHHFIRTLGVSSLDGKVAPGIDVKSGQEDGGGRGFAFIAPTVRRSKTDGSLREYRWVLGPKGPVLPTPDQLAADGSGAMLRARVMELRRSSSSTVSRRVAASVAEREWESALRRLAADVAHWQRHGWGGAAHTAILAATMHLARLNPERAGEGFEWAFAQGGATPDASDWQKLQSALDRAVPDVIVPDHELSAAEAFFMGGDQPPALTSGGSLQTSHLGDLSGAGGTGPTTMTSGPATSSPGEGVLFKPVTRERYRNRKPPPPATYGLFGGAQALFYDEGVHWLQGESESGKTWVGCAVVAEVLRAGGTALYVDYEDTEDRVLGRFEALGVTDDEIERLVYVDPAAAGFRELVMHVHEVKYAVTVIDGVTSSLSASGLSGRDEQELTRWVDLLPRQARMSICIDHVVKSKDDRGGMAIGTQAKKSVVTGSSFEVICVTKFGIGRDGEIRLNLQKDKPAALRGAGVKSVKLVVQSDGATGAVRLARGGKAGAAPATAEGFFAADDVSVRASALLPKVHQWATAHPSFSVSVRTVTRVLREEFNEKASDAVLRRVAQLYHAGTGLAVNLGPEDDEDAV